MSGCGKGSEIIPGQQSNSRSQQAGILYPVRAIIRETVDADVKIGFGVEVYASAVLEYLVAEVLELAAKAASDDNTTCITARHLQLAIRNDEELKTLFNGSLIPEKN